MRVNRRNFTIAAASLLTFGPVGCASVSEKGTSSNRTLMERMPWASKKEELPQPYPNPVKIAATWTPDSLVQSGRTPTRGFGGRIFFYDEKSRPVPVEGNLIVHGFDDLAETPEGRVKRFEFTPEQFTKHFSQTDLGASYSVWIPWDAIGGDQRRISLVTSFKTAEGKAVQGVPATIVLPGRKPEGENTSLASRYSPQYREIQDAQASNRPPTSGLTTTTIQRRRLRYGAEPEANPGLSIPHLGRDRIVATDARTPAVDIKMTRRPSQRSTILPASAEIPVKR